MIADISAATIAALVLSSAAAAAAAAGPTSVGQFSVDKPAFAKLSRTSTGTNLYLSSFQALASDAIFVADAAAAVKSPSTTSPQKLAGTVTWPNEIRDAPASLFGTEGIVAAGGFIVPGKTKGGLFFAPRFANGTHGALTQIFKPSSDWFYHRVAFYDVNKDGKLDILTCRANKPLLGSASGDLVWLQPTDRTRPTGSWTETVIGKGCDTYFIIADLNNDGKDEILSAEFWGKSLTLIQSTDASGRFDVASSLKVTKIDTSVADSFDVQFVDLNGDGKKDILFSNHLASKGAIYGYEIPSNLAEPWTRHTLASDFPVRISGPGQAAPGTPIAFFPNTAATTGKPTIVAAGDGTKQAYIISANSTNAADWGYTQTVLHDCAGTVGEIAVADANGDGRSDIFIPCYDSNYVAVYSY